MSRRTFSVSRGSLYVAGRSAPARSTTRAGSPTRLSQTSGVLTRSRRHEHHTRVPASSFSASGSTQLAPRYRRTGRSQRSDRCLVTSSPNPAMQVSGRRHLPWLLHSGVCLLSGARLRGKYSLYLGPPHCLLGSDGHALTGIFHEARFFTRSRDLWRNRVSSQWGQSVDRDYSVLLPRGSVAV